MYHLFSIVLTTLSTGVAHAADNIPCTADCATKVLGTTADNIGASNFSKNTDLPGQIGILINYAFGILGAVFLTMMLLGGFFWMLAGGNDEKVGKAKSFIGRSVEGLLVIFLAYALVYVVLAALNAATTAVK